ncbi:hypothetical protein EYC80_003135 [Monilinia laxa]|uniref:Uncharacterized protein n=1 Tax=Monilinia laxa TaxID=61186 RepID=A0A5N6KCW2_MONLA|nr:hypothetical protein EYC80_003135 [Monilinia laxa]
MFSGKEIRKKKSGESPMSGTNHLSNMAKCLAANKSKRENEHINEMIFQDEYYRDRMRNIQATYKVKLDSLPGIGYSSRIRLIWDHNRLLGTFELDVFRGSILIDPGPGQDHFKADIEYSKFHEARARDKESSEESGEESDADEGDDEIATTREYRFKWRGVNPKIPHKTFNSSFTVGKIRFGNGKIWGCFEAMSGVGFPGGRCEFHGKIPPGPCLVDMSIQEFIDRWNGYAEIEEDEEPRSPTPRSTMGQVQAERDGVIPTFESMEVVVAQPEEWTEIEQQNFVEMITGIYDITSREIEEDWFAESKGLMVRLHLDQQQGVVFGCFDIGIVEGFLKLDVGVEGFKHYSPMGFKWYGRGTFTGRSEKGTGTITIRTREGRTVEGLFCDMPDNNDGQIDFRGSRRVLPLGVSGRGAGYYRAHWEELERAKLDVAKASPTKGRWGVREGIAKRVSWKRETSSSKDVGAQKKEEGSV